MEEMLKEKETGDEMFMVDDEDENTQANKYLLFNLGDEVYGISIVSVTEIVEMQTITSVPDMPVFVKGVINLRGRVIPVMDLRLLFGMEERAYDDRTCSIIVNIDDTSMGFIVDTVSEVHDILSENIEPPPNFKASDGKNHYISGLGKIGDEVKILIDVKRILLEKDIEAIKSETEKLEERDV